MSVSAIGRVQAFNGTADGVRRTSHDTAHDDEEVVPMAAARKPGDATRHRNAPVTIDLRPDPPDEAPYEARRRVFERTGYSNEGSRRRGAREAAPEPQWTYRANPDAPYRRRTSDETYQAIEAADTPVPHRGGIYDRRI